MICNCFQPRDTSQISNLLLINKLARTCWLAAVKLAPPPALSVSLQPATQSACKEIYVNADLQTIKTSNMTGQNRRPKPKLQAGYRVRPVKCTSYLCGALLCCPLYIIHQGASTLAVCCTSCIFIIMCGIYRHHSPNKQHLHAKFQICVFCSF